MYGKWSESHQLTSRVGTLVGTVTPASRARPQDGPKNGLLNVDEKLAREPYGKGINPSHRVSPTTPLFPRIEKKPDE